MPVNYTWDGPLNELTRVTVRPHMASVLFGSLINHTNGQIMYTLGDFIGKSCPPDGVDRVEKAAPAMSPSTSISASASVPTPSQPLVRMFASYYDNRWPKGDPRGGQFRPKNAVGVVTALSADVDIEETLYRLNEAQLNEPMVDFTSLHAPYISMVNPTQEHANALVSAYGPEGIMAMLTYSSPEGFFPSREAWKNGEDYPIEDLPPFTVNESMMNLLDRGTTRTSTDMAVYRAMELPAGEASELGLVSGAAIKPKYFQSTSLYPHLAVPFGAQDPGKGISAEGARWDKAPPGKQRVTLQILTPEGTPIIWNPQINEVILSPHTQLVVLETEFGRITEMDSEPSLLVRCVLVDDPPSESTTASAGLDLRSTFVNNGDDEGRGVGDVTGITLGGREPAEGDLRRFIATEEDFDILPPPSGDATDDDAEVASGWVRPPEGATEEYRGYYRWPKGHPRGGHFRPKNGGDTGVGGGRRGRRGKDGDFPQTAHKKIGRMPSEKLLKNIVEKSRIPGPDGGKGFTVDILGNSPSEGLAFAPAKNTESIVSDKGYTSKELRKFVTDNYDQLSRPGNYIGGWFNDEDGKWYIDVSKVGEYTSDTIEAARKAKQLAVYDLKTGETTTIGKIENGKYTPIEPVTES